MLYNKFIGRIYDTIFFIILYFCRAEVTEVFKKSNHNLDGAFSFFEEVRNSIEPPPKCLYPLFYYDGKTSSVMMEHMRANVDFHTHTIDDFLNSVADKKKLKKLVFDHLFSHLTDSDREKLMTNESRFVADVINNKLWPSEMAQQITFLISHFPYVANTLHEILIKTYNPINKLHDKYDHIINQRIKETMNKETLILFDKYYSLSKDEVSKQIFSLSFMNQNVIWKKKGDYDNAVFVFGNRYTKSLLLLCDSTPITVDKMLQIMGDPIKLSFIRLFMKHRYLTLSDIARLGSVATSTAFSNINELLDDRVIKENHRKGRKIYFELNLHFFDMAKKIFVEFVDEIHLSQEVKNDDEE